jgi:hypothetical protein
MKFLPRNYHYRFEKPVAAETEMFVLHNGYKRREISLSARIRYYA